MRRTVGVVRAGSGRSGSIHSGRGRSGGSAGSRGRSLGVRASDQGGVNGEFGKFSGGLAGGGGGLFFGFSSKICPVFRLSFSFPFVFFSHFSFFAFLPEMNDDEEKEGPEKN